MQPIAASINDTAKALSLGRTSIYALIREGRLQTIRTLGGSQRVLLESLNEPRDRDSNLSNL